MRRPTKFGRSRRRASDPPCDPDRDGSPAVVPSFGNGLSRTIAPGDFASWLMPLSATEPPEPHPDFLVDWMGVRTRIEMLPWAPPALAGTVSGELPIPDDGYRSEDFEYVALARALSRNTGPFEMIEVGAGWAPWSVAAIVMCNRVGRQARAIAVEADIRRIDWAMQHAADNGITSQIAVGDPTEIGECIARWRDSDGSQLLIVGAAAWHESTFISFPSLTVDDMGGAVQTLAGSNVDYRGAHVQHQTVPAISILTLLNGMRNKVVDLLHVDVQGVEFDLLKEAAREIQDRVALMAVGTHCRLSEGMLLNFFLPRGWGVIVESPCRAMYEMTRPTLAGFTVQDGLQLWENPFVAS